MRHDNPVVVRSPLEDNRVRSLSQADTADVQEIYVRDVEPDLGNDGRINVFVSK